MPRWARDEPARLTYLSNADGKWEVHAWDRTSDIQRQATDRPEGTIRCGLDPSGQWLWWFEDDRGSEFGRWMVEPFAGGERRIAAPDRPPHYDAGLAVARSFAVIGSSTASGSTVHLVREGQPSQLLYQHREAAEVEALSRDETLLCISHSEHGDSRHPALRVLDLSGTTIADLSDGPGRGLWAGTWSPVTSDRRLLVYQERHGTRRPMIWTPETGEIFEPQLDLAGEIDAVWYPDATALLLTHGYRGRSELLRLDLTGNTLRRVDHEPGTVTSAIVRPDGDTWYSWSSSSTPPEVRCDSGVLLSAAGEPAPRGVSYSAHAVDGIQVFVAEPERPRPHPTIFLIHGGPAAADWDNFSAGAQAWVDHGLAVVLVNYRGSAGYGQAWRDALQGNPGLTELEDIAKTHDWVIANGIADRERIILAGGSWGGYLTLLGLGMQPERWSLGIAAVPVADYITAYEEEMEPLKAFDRALFGGSPEEIPDVYRARSPLTHIERLRVPVLILAGQNDPRCPIRQIENYITRLEHLSKAHEVYRYDAGHGSLVIDETIRHLEAEIAFAARHLGTQPPL